MERFPSLTDALARDLEQPVAMHVGPVRATSISDPQATAMAVRTLRASGGEVVRCDDENLRLAWARLAACGVLAELSSAAALHGAIELARRGLLGDDSTVVLLATIGADGQQSSVTDAAVGWRLDDPSMLALRGDRTGC